MRGTTVNSIQFAGSTYAAHFGGNNVNSTVISSTDATVPADPAYLSTASGNQAYVGVKNTSASGSGTLLVPEFDVREVRPFEAFPSGQWDAYFEFTLPETATEDVVIFDGFASLTAKQHSRLTILWRIADEHLVVQLRVNNASPAALDLGEVALGGSHKLAMRMKDADYGASLDGAAAVFSTGLRAVGISSFETSEILTRLALFESMGDNNWLATVTGGEPAVPLWTEGDSMMNGAYGISLSTLLAASTGLGVINTAAGGNSWATITDRIIATIEADPDAKNRTLLPFDGSANSFVSVEDTMERLQAVVDAFGSENWLFIPPLTGRRSDRSVVTDETEYMINMKAVRDAAIARFGAHHVYTSIWEDLQALADGSTEDANDVASGAIPGSLFYTGDEGVTYDGTHLGLVANEAIAAGVTPLILNVRALVEIDDA
jgi:hypothetical protein